MNDFYMIRITKIFGLIWIVIILDENQITLILIECDNGDKYKNEQQ